MQFKSLDGNAKQGMDDKFFVQKITIIFKRFVLGGISQINHHLLILDGHDSHITLEAIKQAQEFGLNMVTLLSHTSHVL